MLGTLEGALGANGNIGLESCSHSLTDALCSLSKVNRGGSSILENLPIPICHPQLFRQIHKEPRVLKNLLNSNAIAWTRGEDASYQVFACLRHWYILWNSA